MFQVLLPVETHAVVNQSTVTRAPHAPVSDLTNPPAHLQTMHGTATTTLVQVRDMHTHVTGNPAQIQNQDVAITTTHVKISDVPKI